MTIITISRGAFSKGKEVAEKVAQRLGYQSVSREVILSASEKFHISPHKLDQALHDAPSFLDRFSSEKQKYIAYVAAEVLACFKNDNVVYSGFGGQFFASTLSHISSEILAYCKNDNVSYSGFAGQFFASTVSHLLTVRIMADLEDRLLPLMQEQHLSREQAVHFLKKEDQARKAWSRRFYGADTTDLTLYDLVIHISKLTVDDVVDIICETAAKPTFKALSESQRAIENLALAAGIRAALLDEYPDCAVVAEGKFVEIFVRYTLHTDTMIPDKITEKVLKIPGVSSVSVILIPSALFT